MRLATGEQMRELDRRAIEERGIASLDLMERAAEGVAKAALDFLPDRLGLTVRGGKDRAAVFCGTGNNGGDGFAAARILREKGVRVRVFLVGDPDKLTPDARAEALRFNGSGDPWEQFVPDDKGQRSWARKSHVFIDALFGVGLSREIAPESDFASAIALINSCVGAVVAADIPSGVEADTGRVLGCAVRADETVTFSEVKVGLAVGDGYLNAGAVRVWDIGIPEDLRRAMACPVQTVGSSFVKAALPPRKIDGHKGEFGKLLIVGGSVGYTGAPYLAAAASVRSGCGLTYLGVPESIWAVEAGKCLSSMPFPLADKGGGLDRKALPEILKRAAGCDALALGPGLGRRGETERLVLDLLDRVECPIILDADGINALEAHIDRVDRRSAAGRVTILTPHDGEFARVGGDVSIGRVQAARDFAAAHGCVLVLKGHRTVTASPAGNALVNTTGSSGLAKGGSGDVLTGIIASLLAQGVPPVQAAAAGAWLHGRAGDAAEQLCTARGMTPGDVVNLLPEVFRDLEEE